MKIFACFRKNQSLLISFIILHWYTVLKKQRKHIFENDVKITG